MSIINDALKKAEKKKQFSYDKPFRILSEIDQVKTDAERFILRRWLIWAGTGAVCLLGVVLVSNTFKKPVGFSPEQRLASKPQGPAVAAVGKKPASRFSAAHSQFNLSGILYDSQNPMAIINERVVAEGGLINGAKLLEIQSNSVRLSFKGKELILTLK